MRKASREMDSAWALEVMRKAPYITVSFTRPDGSAYGLPLSLASVSDDVWYFHCALEGDKLDAIASHPGFAFRQLQNVLQLLDQKMVLLLFNIVRQLLSVRQSWLRMMRKKYWHCGLFVSVSCQIIWMLLMML